MNPGPTTSSVEGVPCVGRAVVDYLRAHGPANLCATAMSVPIAEQVMAALDLIQGKDGSSRGPQKIQALQENATYFRRKLQKLGCIVLGTGASPIVVSHMCPPARPPPPPPPTSPGFAAFLLLSACVSDSLAYRYHV